MFICTFPHFGHPPVDTDGDGDGSGDFPDTSGGMALTTPSGTTRCRPEDNIKCENNTHVEICSVQLCDGIQDCPDNEDEVNCPHGSTGSSFYYHFD